MVLNKEASARYLAMSEASLGILATRYQNVPGEVSNQFVVCKSAPPLDTILAQPEAEIKAQTNMTENQSPMTMLGLAVHPSHNFLNKFVLENKEKNIQDLIHLNSYKYSKPRVYVQNTYPDSGITNTEYLREISIMYGPKIRSTKYNDYVNSTLSLPRQKQSPRKKKPLLMVHLNLNYLTNGSMKLVEINISNHNIVSLVDTGSSHNLLNIEIFKELDGAQFTPVNMCMKVAGSTLRDNVVGKTRLSTRLCCKNYVTHEIYVDYIIAHHTNGYDAILGASFLFDEKIVQSITTQGVILHDSPVPACITFTEKSAKFNPNHFLTLRSTTVINSDEKLKVLASIDPPILKQSLISFKTNLTILNMQFEILNVSICENSSLASVILYNRADYAQTLPKHLPLCTAEFCTDSSCSLNLLELNGNPSSELKTSLNNNVPPNVSPDYTTDIEDEIIAESVVVDPTKLTRKFSYKDCTVNIEIPEMYVKKLWTMLKEHKTIFATSKLDVGQFKPFLVQIEIDKPIPAEKQRYLSPEKVEFCQKTFETFEKLGLIQECHNPKTVGNLLLVPKYEGLRDLTKASTYSAQVRGEKVHQFRIVHDMRRVNANTKNVKKSHPVLPESIFAKMQNKIVSSIDANQAYWHLQLDHESRPWTCFYLGKKLYQFNRMAQGMMNSPGCWDEALSIIFSERTMSEIKKSMSKSDANKLPDGFESFFAYYQDDSWIISNNFDEHLIHIEAVLKAYKMYDIKISAEKSTFFAKNLKVLGVQVNPSQAQLSLDEVKAKSILTWEKPDSLYTLQSRLYSFNYWQKFIPNLSELKFPLNQILKSGVFSWDATANAAWERIKSLIALDIKLTIPNRDDQLVLTCDASKLAISCILWVAQGDNLRVVGCYSKMFSHTDTQKSIHFKETYAMVESFRHFRPYLLNSNKSIIVFTDARSLMWISRNREYSIAANGLVNKLAKIQLEIPYVVYSVPSEVNYLADVFSRSYTDSRFLDKTHFALSKIQANKLPPLREPTVLSEHTLYIYFSTPLTPKEDDIYPRYKNKVPTPKPVKDLFKMFLDCTPEERYLSAIRVLQGWNDKSIIKEGGPNLNLTEIIEKKEPLLFKDLKTDYRKNIKGEILRFGRHSIKTNAYYPRGKFQ